MSFDIQAIEKKWQHEWESQKTFQPEVDEREKFLCTFPYPYVNGLPHVGHLFTMMRVEAFARYKRAKGFNVLFPQGWHATGSPIVAAALRVREGDEKQLQILRDFGVEEKELHKFEEPEYWIEYFVPEYKQDVQRLGMSIDWRRELITTDIDPRYDKFIKWQFTRMHEKGYVQKGKHPVVWCAKEQIPISDHDRRTGEGETPQEFTLVMFTLPNTENPKEDLFHIPCATLRPETIPGLTNLWMNPDEEYMMAEVGAQTWLLSESAMNRLKDQEHKVRIVRSFPGSDLMGKLVTGPEGRQIPILPATFVSMDKGTGIVMSVPSDAPDDYIALRDIQEDEDTIKKYKLDTVKDIKPIPIIDAPDLGDLAAVKVVEEFGIKSQKDRKKLEEAKKLVYKKGFYEGIMIAGPYKGEKVEFAKDNVRQDLLAENKAVRFWELTGSVVCRCGQTANVKIVQDQWFITYSNPEWKERTQTALDNLKLYPEKARSQFNYVIGWLRDWACARDKGLGTRLPWDDRWIIEALSDSTLYNAYYTFSHLIKDIDPDQVTNELFDYVFYGQGAPQEGWEEMRKQYEYWYPVDFRNSGKDLIQNHLSFMLFTHAALLPEDKWPVSYGVNGWVTVDGQKMSKSLGNLIPVRDMCKEYGADVSRLTILNGGEGMDDPNWDSNFAKATQQRVQQFMAFCEKYVDGGRVKREAIDIWFESVVNRIILDTTNAYDQGLFRTAIQHAWFDLSAALKKYVNTTIPRGDVTRWAINTQLQLIQPIMPHIAEEMWHKLGNHGFISTAPWPVCHAEKINLDAEQTFNLVEGVQADIKHVMQLAKIKQPRLIRIMNATHWKYELVTAIKNELETTYNPKEVIGAIMKTELKQHGQAVTKLIGRYLKNQSLLPRHVVSADQEMQALIAAQKRLELAFGAKIEILFEHESDHAKASGALPGKPAVVIE